MAAPQAYYTGRSTSPLSYTSRSSSPLGGSTRLPVRNLVVAGGPHQVVPQYGDAPVRQGGGPWQGSEPSASSWLRLQEAERQFREAQLASLERFLAEQRQVFISLGMQVRGTELAQSAAPNTLPEKEKKSVTSRAALPRRPSPHKGKHSKRELHHSDESDSDDSQSTLRESSAEFDQLDSKSPCLPRRGSVGTATAGTANTGESESDASGEELQLWKKTIKHVGAIKVDPLEGFNKDQLIMSTIQKRKDTIKPRNALQRCLLPVTQHWGFQVFSAILVLSMSLLLGIDIECRLGKAWRNREKDSVSRVPGWVQSISVDGQHVTYYLFVFEMSMRLLAEQREFLCRKHSLNWWNIFDSLILAINTLTYFELKWGWLAVVRILRLFRLISIINYSKDLRNMFYSVAACVVSLLWFLLFCTMLSYAFSVYCLEISLLYIPEAQKTDDTEFLDLLQHRYGSLLETMKTMTYSITGGMDWADNAEPFFMMSLVHGVVFCAFVLSTTLGLLNVLVGIFVQKSEEIGDLNMDVALANAHSKQQDGFRCLIELFNELDTSRDGEIFLEDLRQGVAKPRIRAYFNHLNIDFTDPDLMWEILDSDGGGTIDQEEFVKGCSRLQGSAKPAEVAEILSLSKKTISLLEDKSSDRRRS